MTTYRARSARTAAPVRPVTQAAVSSQSDLPRVRLLVPGVGDGFSRSRSGTATT